jgi:squalene-hopene/tetraprenyl-beta-curcumene cyclase
MSRMVLIAGVVALAGMTAAAEETDPFPKPGRNKPDEPRAPEYSAAKAADFLDRVAVNWTRDRKCATCHTNVAYLMARGALKEGGTEGAAIVRKFFEDRVKNWEEKRGVKRGEPVTLAAPLALDDARQGKLQPVTRRALDAMWTAQGTNGAWDWPKCAGEGGAWPPFEHDDYFGAVLAAVAAGHAPDNYAATDRAKLGLERLRVYFRKVPPPSLHHKAWLLWASMKLDGLMTKAEREQTIKELLAKQHGDGGWSLASLGDWKGFDGRRNNTDAPSDGYGTGLGVFVLRQAGPASDRPEVRKGIDWLRNNQRESGRWFTQSLNTDSSHFITHAGSAFAVLALEGTEK